MNKVEFLGFLVRKHLLRETLKVNLKKRIKIYSYKDVIEKFLPFNERNMFNYFLLRVFFLFRKKIIKIFISKIIFQVREFIKNLYFKVLRKNFQNL